MNCEKCDAKDRLLAEQAAVIERARKLETACRWLRPNGVGYGDVKAALLEIDSQEKTR